MGDGAGGSMGFFADMGLGLKNSVATRIAQIADSGSNLIRFMTAPPRNSAVEARFSVLRMNYVGRSTSLIDPVPTSTRLADSELRSSLYGAGIRPGNSRETAS